MSADEADMDSRRRRAVFRAGHRGTREMDWLLGRYADAEVEAMDGSELTVFERLLALPDPDIEQWIMYGARPRPDGSLGELIEHVRRFHGIDG